MFRSILSSELVALDNKPKKPLLRGELYSKLRSSEGYMPYEEMRKMMEHVMPSAMESLGEDLKLLEIWVSDYAKNLAKNEACVDVAEETMGWLTCVKIRKEDISWRAKRSESAESRELVRELPMGKSCGAGICRMGRCPDISA